MEFYDKWRGRVAFLDELYLQGHADEAVILCCRYIEAIAGWDRKSPEDGREAFVKALLRFGARDVFGRLNPALLLQELRGGADARWGRTVAGKLAPALDAFREGFHPEEKISRVCREALGEEDFASVEKVFWTATPACHAHALALRTDLDGGSIALRGTEGTVLDFPLFYSALRGLLEYSKGIIVSGKLRTY